MQKSNRNGRITKMLKKLLKINIVALLIVTQPAISQEVDVTPECAEPVIECVNACNGVIQQADEAFKAMHEESALQQEINKKQDELIKAQKQELSAFYRDPVIMGLLGALAAGIVIKK